MYVSVPYYRVTCSPALKTEKQQSAIERDRLNYCANFSFFSLLSLTYFSSLSLSSALNCRMTLTYDVSVGWQLSVGLLLSLVLLL